MAQASKSNLPRLITLFIGFLGCVITAVPVLFDVGGNPVLLILIGSGLTVVALALFLLFSL